MTRVSDVSEDPGLRRTRSPETALVGIYEISKLLTIPANLEATLSGVLALLSSFLDLRHGLIALLGRDGAPEVVVGSGWSQATAKRYFQRLPERAIGQIVATRMPVVIERMEKDPLFESWDFSEWDAGGRDSSFVGVPIKERGEVVGTLTIDREAAEQSSYRLDDDVRFLTMVANLLGQTVRLHHMIVRDRERLMGEQRRLEKVIEHREAPAAAVPSGHIIGQTPQIRAVLEKVGRAATGSAQVLLRGESGTGKELFARALHELSPRRAGPFVAVNCAALSESVLESELFGHERGSFTGATALRRGRFELASGGTLFLDEIGEISLSFQAKLLRVLQLGEFERVGGTSTIKVDFRLVAATNRDLEEAVARKEFRADLYFRVAVVPIFLPPLRERREDIPFLAREFLARFDAESNARHELTESALSVLNGCHFPGNVRELESCIRRTATFARGARIVADDFACRNEECLSSLLWNKDRADGAAGGAGQTAAAETEPRPAPERAVAAPDSSAEREGGERERLVAAMQSAGWVQAKAARLLGITPRQIGYALRKHGIEVKKF